MNLMQKMPTNLNDVRSAWRIANNYPVHTAAAFNVAKKNTETDFYIFDVIGLFDGEAEAFVKEVASTDGPINLHINSPGGFVWDALAMYDALVTSSNKVHVKINGIAASAASFIAMAGDTRQISEAGRVMIHDAQGIAIGNPADIREYADLLDSVSDDIAGIYETRTGTSAKAWRSAMNKTTWYNAGQAVDSKLVDSVAKNNVDKSPDNRTKLIQARMKVLTRKGK